MPQTRDKITVLRLNDLEEEICGEGSLSGQLAAAIGRRIVTGEVREDAHLPRETDVAEYLGISRTVVREAFRSLAAKGLVVARQRAGTSVNPRAAWHLFDRDILLWLLAGPLDNETLRDLVELRMAVEPEVASLAAERADGEQLESIRAAWNHMEASDSDRAYYEGDLAFHEAIFDASGNVFLTQLKSPVILILRSAFKLQYRSLIHRSEGRELHRMVLRRIEDRDPEGARNVMRYIIEVAKEELSEVGALSPQEAQSPIET